VTPGAPRPATTTVLIDAQPLSSVAAGGGVGTYLRELLAAVGRRDDLVLRALCPAGVDLPSGVAPVPVRRLFSRPRLEATEHSLRLGVEVWRHQQDGLFHNPSFHAPAGLRSPWVQTLLDLIPLIDGSPDQRVLRKRWRRFGPRYRRADAIVAISQHAADDGIRLLGLDPKKVHVARLGVDAAFHPGAGPSEPPYVLVVGEFSRRKGFEKAFAVIDDLADAGLPHRLVVVGRIHPWARAELVALWASARHPERIELRGFVPDVVPLYQGAAAFLMTSSYEGFGLPVLEAMACGVPVVAFSNSSLTEVVGNGGQLVPDGDVSAMSAAVRTVLENPGAAEEWGQRGVRRAAPFTWDACATLHAEVYRSVAP